MNVGHTVENIKRCFSKMRGKLTTTRVISGFPTETEEDVRQTIRLLRELDLDRWDVLRYVDSPDVPSGMLEKISEIQSEKHYHMYKKEILKNDQKFKSKIEGQKIEAYVSAKSLCYLIAYYPKKGVYIYLDMKPEYFDLNLNDKILVAFKNHKCFLEEVIEKGKIKTNKTNAVKRFNNQLSMILMHFDTMTSEYALPYEELSYIFNKIFYSYARDNCNEEIFQARIAHLPEALRNALIEAFKTR